MIGIKGVGMTMLAQFLAEKGYEISGSDTDEKFMTDEVLESEGIKVFEGFSLDNIQKDADLIIYSTAYKSDTNIEVSDVLKGDIKVLTYAEVLGELFGQMHGIAICGTHGKTTTTAWLGYVMMKSGLKPNVLVGSRVEQFEGASIVGESNYLAIEADEYQNKLKYYNPKVVLLNNIEHDHHDFYPTFEGYLQAFVDFIAKIPSKGLLVANFDDLNIAKIANVNCKGKVISYAIENNEADFVAYDVKIKNGKQYFKVRCYCDEDKTTRSNVDEGEELGEFAISLSGKHNILNALSVIATCIELEVELKDIREHLEDFTGTERRAKIMGKFRGATIIDDYAHHPTEIKTTLNGFREVYDDKKITVIFHPHHFTRTKVLLDDFATSFESADKIIVLDIYGSAREVKGDVSSLDLVEKIKINEKDKEVLYIPDLKEAEEYLRQNIERDDIIVLMGAGDVFRIGEALVN
jgi:UDP-N-acetylmuramate--alanine ligase